MNIDVEEPQIVLEVMATVGSVKGTEAHDKADISDDSRGHVAGLVLQEPNTAGTESLNQHGAILPATGRVEATIVVGHQSKERIRIVVEKRLTDCLGRLKEVFGCGQGDSSVEATAPPNARAIAGQSLSNICAADIGVRKVVTQPRGSRAAYRSGSRCRFR